MTRSMYLTVGLLIAALLLPAGASAATPDVSAAWHRADRVYEGRTAQGTYMRFRLTRNGRQAYNLYFGRLNAACGDAPNEYVASTLVYVPGPVWLRGNTFDGGVYGSTNVHVYGAFQPGGRANGIVEFANLACGTGGITWSGRAR